MKHINTRDRILSILVLLGAFGQILAAATITPESFNSDTINSLLIYTQPAPFIFSIWGLIYALCVVFAIYQTIPSSNSEYLVFARPYVLSAFIGTSLWLWFAVQETGLLWVTAPLLVAIAYVLYKAIMFQRGSVQGKNSWERLASTYSLYPFAAWTLIASGVNIHSMLVQYGIISNVFLNVFIALTLLIAVFVFTVMVLRAINISPWYGLVFVWATLGIVIANIIDPNGAWLIAVAAGILGLYVAGTLISAKILRIK